MNEQDFGTISLNDEQPPFGNISLNEPDQVPAVPPEQAHPRALKAHFGLGSQSPGFEPLFNGIANGQEGQLRQDISREYDSYLRLQKMSAIQGIAEQGSMGNVEHAKALWEWNPKSNPDTIFEKTYAQQYVSTVANNEQATTMAALSHDEEASHAIMDKAQDVVTNQETFKKIEQEAEDFYNKQWYGSSTIQAINPLFVKGVQDIATAMTPLLSAMNTRNIVAQTQGILPGNNLDEQITFLWGLPPEQAAEAFRTAIRKLQVANPLDALTFARAVNHFSEQHRIDLNVAGVLDATIVAGPLFKLAKLMKGAIKGNAAKTINVGNTLEDVGDIEKAADIKAVEQVTARSQPTVMPTIDKGFDPLGQKLDLTSTLPSFANPKSLMIGQNKGSLSRQRAAQIADVLIEDNKEIENTMSKVLRVSRTTETQLQMGLERTAAKLEQQYPHLQDKLLDLANIRPYEHLMAEDTRTNVDYVLMNVGKPGKEDVLVNDLGFPLGPIEGANKKGFIKAKQADFGEVVIGKEGSTLFNTYDQANQYAFDLYQLHYKEARVLQGPGNTWYISIIKPVDETDKALRALSIDTRNKNSESWANYMAGYYLTPANQVSQFIRDNRLIATSASTEVHKLVKRLIEPIQGSYLGQPGLSKYQFRRMNDVLEYYRDFVDYSKPQNRGKYPTSLSQLEKDWKEVTGSLPTAREQEAFWSVIKVNDFDFMLRNYNLHRDLARQNIEHVGFPHPSEEGIYTQPVMGKILGPDDMKNFWSNPENANIAIFRNKEWEYTDKHGNRFIGDDELREWIKHPNTKVVQIANPDDRPLKGVLDHNPHFVISEDVQHSELPIKLIDYNGGGHVIYPGKWYVKQPIVEQGLLGKHYHYGDQTIFNFNSAAQAKLYSKRMDDFRLMLKEGKTDAELNSFVEKYLPKDLAFWKQKFIGDNAILSLDHPIMITERNNPTFTTNPLLKQYYKDRLGGEDVISYPDSSYNLMGGVDKSFLMERDGPLMTIESSRYAQWTPVYSLVPAKTLKPLQAMDQGIQSAIRGLYMNDVKTATIEQFIQQYKSFIDMPIDKVERNPYFAFYHGPSVKANSENAVMLGSMENARRNLKNFLRTSTGLQAEIDVAEERFMERLLNQTDDKVVNWYADHDLYLIKHPIDFLSKAVSSMKFGFFNVVQTFVQSAQALFAMGFHPIHGYSGATGAVLTHWATIAEGRLSADVSKEVLNILDKSASKLGGWGKGWFKQSMQTLNSSGFYNIGKEVSIRDSLMEQSLFTSKLGTFHDKGYGPFNFGERNARLVAWHMAFHEWKTNNPTKELLSRDAGEILNRANMYNADMTRESNSAFQQGVVGSIPMKFQSFRQRIAEQFWDDRFTNREKVNAILFSSMMFGVPTTIGATGIPWAKIPGGIENYYEDLRKAAIDRGFTLNNKYLKWFHEGILDQIVEAATGTSYSISKRLGPGPDTSIRDLLDPEKFFQTAFGAMGGMLESAAKAMYPLYAGVYTAIRGGQDQYTVTHDEILDVIKELSVVNNAHNAYMAWNYQRYVSRNKQILVDPKVSSTGLAPMSKTDAAMMLLVGATRKDISDTRLGQDVFKNQTDAEDMLGKRAVEEMRKAYQALGDEDLALADKYIVNAKIMLTILGDASEQKQLQVQKQALSEVGTTVVDRINQLLYDPQRMPKSRIPARMLKHFNIDTRQGSPF